MTDNRKSEAQESPRTLEAIGDFSAKIGHDVNNLLGSIRGCVDLIKVKLDKLHPEGSPVARQVAIIESAIEKGIGLTAKLRGFVRSGDRERVEISLDRLLEQVVDLMGKHAGAVEVTLHVDSSPTVTADEFAVTHLIASLCMNACEAMQKLKDPQLVLYCDEEELDGSTQGLSAGRYARVTIIDHGVGISSSVRERIFEPFFSTKRGGVGEGLGLSLSMGKELLRRHGGDITISSQENAGTAVRLYFPVVEKA